MTRLALLSAALLVLGSASAAAAGGGPGVRPACVAAASPSLSGARSVPLAVYLVRNESLAPVRRVVPGTSAVARAAIERLLHGPTAAERRAGYSSAIPAGTRLRGVSLAGGVLAVDLTGRYEAGGGSLSMLLRVAQVVYTATRFPSVERVAFRLDGRPVQAIGGEGVAVAPPVGRAGFEGQAPPILVEQPLPGDRVSSPLVVRGTADVFEGQFLVDVTTPGGTVLARRTVSAGAGSGVRRAFALSIPLATRATRLVVVAYDRSARNGARIHVVRVPVDIGQRLFFSSPKTPRTTSFSSLLPCLDWRNAPSAPAPPASAPAASR